MASSSTSSAAAVCSMAEASSSFSLASASASVLVSEAGFQKESVSYKGVRKNKLANEIEKASEKGSK